MNTTPHTTEQGAPDNLPYPDIFGGCPCYACWDKRTPVNPEFGFKFSVMNLCPTCGNKRCPAAMDHERFVCGGSNEPGQIPRYRDDSDANSSTPTMPTAGDSDD